MKSAASYCYSGCEDYENYHPHFLDSCSLCQRYITQNSDIFMYRGDTPFCSEECRQEQIEMDEANEIRRLRAASKSKRSSSKSIARSQSKDSSKECDTNKAVRTGTVAVA